jgi:hypothetical protein
MKPNGLRICLSFVGRISLMVKGMDHGGDIFGLSCFQGKENKVFSIFSRRPSIATFMQAILRGICGCSNSWLLIGRCSNPKFSVKQRKCLWLTPFVP